MEKTLYYSAGSEQYLTNEIKEHPDKILCLAEDQRFADKYLLFDFTGHDNIMGSDSNQLNIDYEVGNDKTFAGFIYLQSFDLPKERDISLISTAKKVLDNTNSQNAHLKHGYLAKLDKHPRTIILLTIWDDHAELDDWLNGETYALLKPLNSHSLNNFHEFAKIVND